VKRIVILDHLVLLIGYGKEYIRDIWLKFDNISYHYSEVELVLLAV
jgi:hypothetical protein